MSGNPVLLRECGLIPSMPYSPFTPSSFPSPLPLFVSSPARPPLAASSTPPALISYLGDARTYAQGFSTGGKGRRGASRSKGRS